MIKLTTLERETIYTYNEAEQSAQCFTYNKKLINQLTQLSEQRPEECLLLSDNGCGGLTYSIPKKWVKIRPSRIMSEEQRRELSERMKNNQKTKSGN